MKIPDDQITGEPIAPVSPRPTVLYRVAARCHLYTGLAVGPFLIVLCNHRYLHYSYMDMDVGHTVQKWLQGSGRENTREMISNNGDVLIEAAIAGAGIALQPTFIAGAAIREGKLKVILPEHEPEPMALYAVYAHRQLLARKVRSFIDFIDGFFGEPPYWDRFK